jgi:hypothetical protein
LRRIYGVRVQSLPNDVAGVVELVRALAMFDGEEVTMVSLNPSWTPTGGALFLTPDLRELIGAVSATDRRLLASDDSDQP